MVGIKSIPVNDRPRERLLNDGSGSLSNIELLSIILNSGNRNNSVKDIAYNIMGSIKDISELKNMNYSKLININGIGCSKACIILSLIELSKRMNRSIEVLNKVVFKNPSIIFEYYKNILDGKMQEYFYCVYLDSKKRIINDKLLFIGTVDRSLVHPRDIYREAYVLSASSIICVHNHPSNSVLPSREDVFLTKLLKQTGEIMGIELNDHIIIGNDKYYSFFENGEL